MKNRRTLSAYLSWRASRKRSRFESLGEGAIRPENLLRAGLEERRDARPLFRGARPRRESEEAAREELPGAFLEEVLMGGDPVEAETLRAARRFTVSRSTLKTLLGLDVVGEEHVERLLQRRRISEGGERSQRRVFDLRGLGVVMAACKASTRSGPALRDASARSVAARSGSVLLGSSSAARPGSRVRLRSMSARRGRGRRAPVGESVRAERRSRPPCPWPQGPSSSSRQRGAPPRTAGTRLSPHRPRGPPSD